MVEELHAVLDSGLLAEVVGDGGEARDGLDGAQGLVDCAADSGVEDREGPTAAATLALGVDAGDAGGGVGGVEACLLD